MFFHCFSANNSEKIEEHCFYTPSVVNTQILNVGDFVVITNKGTEFPGEVNIVDPDVMVSVKCAKKDTT